MTLPTKKRIRCGLIAVGWSLLAYAAAVAFRCQLHGWQWVDRSTAAVFVAGVACLWVASELNT
ncbi:MAG: hypothetical protein ACLPT4_07380 [Verrucomicrobiia bacterium]